MQKTVLSGGAIQYQQDFSCGIGQLPFHDAADFVQLIHQILLVMESAGGVNENHICALGFGRLDAVEHHRCGVCALVLTDNAAAGALGPDFQLVSCGGAEGIACYQQNILPLLGQLSGNLADGGGFAHAVDTDDQHHRGGCGQIQGSIAHIQHIH